ncbi:hypothetical protein ABW19_dt0204532 [Dactylella cylindrospora]|nr:hypothetical protein ABW19_dt0204532 [Dactylella cylindrospora]
MPKVEPAIAASQNIVALNDYADWTARRVATYTRVLENAIAKIRKEVEIASYSSKDVSSVSFKQLFTAPEPASKWEWDPKTEQELNNEVSIRRTSYPPARKQGYADASRRKGISLQPRRPSPTKEGPTGSAFKNYLQNPRLRRNLLITSAIPAVKPHYATILSHHASILSPRKDEAVCDVPSLSVLSARAFGRAIVMARDSEDPQGDYSWYSYCDENSTMYYLLTETLRGQITQLLCDALKEDWFPQDLASTIIAQSVHAGDAALTETLFCAAYRNSFDGNRSIARRKGELAPDPFSHILYMPDILFRQLGHAIEERPLTMLDAWFRDVMFVGIGEIGLHSELPKLAAGCLEMLLGIEVWEAGVHRRRLNRSGKEMRKKFESFDKAWLFQSKDILQSKAADVAQDLVERLFDVGWGALDVDPLTRSTARSVMYTLVERMVLWAHAFNHPHKEASEGSSITARTLALCATLLSDEDDLMVSVKEVTEELVRLLLVTMIEASEEDKDLHNDDGAGGSFDLPDLAKYVGEVISRVYPSPIDRQEFTEGLLNLAIGNAKVDFTCTPAIGDKQKLQQKRQNYLVAIFAYHLATALAESSKSEASHSFASEIEHRLVGLRISKKGLLKASDLKTPKFSNLIRDVALSEARSSRWVYEPMLNEWVEVPAESDAAVAVNMENTKAIKRISRKLNFAQKQTKTESSNMNSLSSNSDGSTSIRGTDMNARVAQQIGSFRRLSINSDSSGQANDDTTMYPNSADTTISEGNTSPRVSQLNFLVEVCIQETAQSPSPAPTAILVTSDHSTSSNKITTAFRQSKGGHSLSTRKFNTEKEKRMGMVFAGVENHPIKRKRGRLRISTASIDTLDSDIEMVAIGEGKKQTANNVPGALPRKRGRPPKRDKSAHNPIARDAEQTTTTDSAYEPDSDDDKINHLEEKQFLRSIKEKRLNGQTRDGKRKRVQHDSEEVELDIYQDELDLISTRRSPRRLSGGKDIFRDTGKSKLNMKGTSVRGREGKGQVPDTVALPARKLRRVA